MAMKVPVMSFLAVNHYHCLVMALQESLIMIPVYSLYLAVDDDEEDNEYVTYDFDEDDGSKQEEDEEGGDSPDTTIMDELKDYISHFSSHTCNLIPDDRARIELLDILIKQRAPMRIFDDIYRWHTSNSFGGYQIWYIYGILVEIARRTLWNGKATAKGYFEVDSSPQ